MPKAEKFHEMVARVAMKNPAHAQAIAAFNKRNFANKNPVKAVAPNRKVVSKPFPLAKARGPAS